MGLNGILLVDKQAGWTSHDVVAKARRLVGERRIGHSGTLDPMATGLLVLCIGQATRLVEYVSGHDKRYVGVITLGVATTTDDAEGEVVSEAPAPQVAPETLRALEARFTGELMQRPPAYSAVKVAGKRAYAVARKGGNLELQARPVVVHRIGIRERGPGALGIEVWCGAGTYIRSLARDIGEALGCGAHLSALRRLACGRFDVAEAVTLERVAELAAAGKLEEVLWAPDEGVADHDAALIEGARADILRHGGSLTLREPPRRHAVAARLYDAGGEFVGMGRVEADGTIRPRKVLASG